MICAHSTILATDLAEAYLSRQPIFRRNMDVYAYELLVGDRQTPGNAGVLDGDRAAAEVSLKLIDFGMGRVTGDDLAFVNVTRNFILNGSCRSLPPDRSVLVVPGEIMVDPEVVEHLEKLRLDGYSIALDDIVDEEIPAAFVELADIIRIDVAATDADRLGNIVDTFSPFKVRFLAANVGSQLEFEICRDMDLDYFQGSFFCKPKRIESSQIPTNRLATMRLAARLQNPDIRSEELEEIIRQDLTLSYRLLRLANSAFTALPRNVESIGHAARLIGMGRIRTWASVLMLCSMDEKPRELIVTAIIRSRMCEYLAVALGCRLTERYFTVGLFSVVDALLDCPLEDVLEQLPLSSEIATALTTRQEMLGRILDFTIAYETADQERLSTIGLELGVDPTVAREAYLAAIQRMRELTLEMAI
jgi:EAL and modified HD-GYP domain-containing signal transduction protein